MKSQYFITACILSILLFLQTRTGHAISRSSGAEIQYQYVSDSSYRIFYKFYQACSSTTPEPDFVTLCYRSSSAACGFNWQSRSIYKMINPPDGTPNGQMVDMGCPGQGNTCTDPSSTEEMYRVWWYSDIVQLPACGIWTLSVNSVSRDVGSTNLLPQVYPNGNLYVEANINTQLASKQSSPFSSFQLPVYATANNPFHFNLGMTDPDGDVLVYTCMQPLSAQADFTVICAGYTPFPINWSGAQYNTTNNPLLCNNTFSINAQNGDINFTPSATQVACMTYRVDKYRAGILIGSVMMDNRLEVKTGTTPPINVQVNPASVTGGTWTNDTLRICSNNQLSFCFDVSSTSATAQLQASDNHFLSMKNAAVTYTNQGTAAVSGCVTWTPHLADTGFKYFMVKVKDVSCGVPVFQTYKIAVWIRPSVEILAKDTIVCPGASAVFTGGGGTNYTWSAVPAAIFSCTSCPLTTITPSGNTQITLTAALTNGCPNTDTRTLFVDHSNSIDATPDTTVFCEGGAYVNFNAVASGPGPLRTIACGAYSPQSATNLADANLMQNSNSSNNNTQYNLYYGLSAYWGPFYQAFYTQKTQVIFRKEELSGAGMLPGSIQKVALNFATNSTNINPTYQNVKIAMRCTDKTEFLSAIANQFETGLAEVFSAPSYTIVPGINEFILTVPYDYDTSKNLIVQFCYSGNSNIVPTNSSNMLPVYYVGTPYKSTLYAGQTSTGNACTGNLGTVIMQSRRPDMRFTFSPLPAAPFQYNWTPSTGMSNPAAAHTGLTVNSSKWFTVSTKGRLGCEVKDSVYVYVAKKDFVLYPDESNICKGESVRLNVTGGYTFDWYNADFTTPLGFNCLQCDTPGVAPPTLGLHEYKVVVADFFGCSDTLDARITVVDIPNTHILNNDTTINYGQSVQLFAEGAATYLWDPIATLNRHNIANPIATPQESTLYTVNGYSIGGCGIKDSVWVHVILSEDAFIPNAFSPNGDGVNDVFQVGNLIYQRIVAFRVFDRWGNMVYEAGPGQNGWDGTFHGKAMPLGTYFYNIVLELKHGNTKNYKGDLTLVR